MNNGKTIFSQIMSNIPEREFKACVDRYKGNYRSRNFICKDQFLVMSYAQLTNRGSLRDIENCLTALSSRLYHCGISYAVPRNTLAKANMRFDITACSEVDKSTGILSISRFGLPFVHTFYWL